MLKWLGSRIREPSTWGALGGVLLIACLQTFTYFPHWRLLGYAAGVCFIIQALREG